MATAFRKLHGLGNDFVFMDLRHGSTLMTPALAAAICHRQLGVGADGILVFTGTPDEPAMKIYNSDGSVPEMCGNGIRCFVMALVRHHGATANPLRVNTDAGERYCAWRWDGERFMVKVDMGEAVIGERQISLLEAAGGTLPTGLDAPAELSCSVVSTGNPHLVLFHEFDASQRAALGPLLTASAAFPKGTNTEFAVISGQDRVDLVVHERGAGFTLACGTGACATVAAGVDRGLLSPDTPVSVRLPGGELLITVDASGNRMMMEGPAVEVFEGAIWTPAAAGDR